MKRESRDNRRFREDQEDQAARKYHSGREPLKQDEGSGVIAPNDPDLIDFSKNAFSIDLSVVFV